MRPYSNEDIEKTEKVFANYGKQSKQLQIAITHFRNFFSEEVQKQDKAFNTIDRAIKDILAADSTIRTKIMVISEKIDFFSKNDKLKTAMELITRGASPMLKFLIQEIEAFYKQPGQKSATDGHEEEKTEDTEDKTNVNEASGDADGTEDFSNLGTKLTKGWGSWEGVHKWMGGVKDDFIDQFLDHVKHFSEIARKMDRYIIAPISSVPNGKNDGREDRVVWTKNKDQLSGNRYRQVVRKMPKRAA